MKFKKNSQKVILLAMALVTLLCPQHVLAEQTVLTGDYHHTVVNADATKFTKRDIDQITQLIHNNLQIGEKNPFNGELSIKYTTPRSIEVTITPPFEGVHKRQLLKGGRKWVDPQAKLNPRSPQGDTRDPYYIHRNLPIENGDDCPNRLINEVIRFTNKAQGIGWIESVSIVPRDGYPGKSCYDKSVFIINAKPSHYLFMYDGYQEMTRVNGETQIITKDQPDVLKELSVNDPAFYVINNFDIPGFYVVTMLHGNLTLARRSQHEVNVTGRINLPDRELDEIAMVVHDYLQIGPQNSFKGTLKVHVKNKEGVDVSFTNNEGKNVTLPLMKSRQRWIVSDEKYDPVGRYHYYR